MSLRENMTITFENLRVMSILENTISLLSAAFILARSGRGHWQVSSQSSWPIAGAFRKGGDFDYVFFVGWSTKLANYLYITVIRKYNTYSEPLLDNECIFMQ